MLSPEAWMKWKRRRKLTTIVFVIENILIGSDFSLTFLTLWLYLEELVKPNTPKMYYSVISASFLLASMSLSLVMGRYVDKNRNIKSTFLLVNIIVVIGNIIYTLQYSPLFLIAGRLLSGLSGPLRSVISGEIARCYPIEELSAKYSIMGMAYSLGFITGPIVNFSFKKLDITLGTWRVTYVNAPGLFLAFMFLVLTFMTIFMVFDLSKEYDMKAERERADSLRNDLIFSSSSETEVSELDKNVRSPLHNRRCEAGFTQKEETTLLTADPKHLDYSTFHANTTQPYTDDDSGSFCHTDYDHQIIYKNGENSKLSISYFERKNPTTITNTNRVVRRKRILSISTILKKLFTNFDTALLLFAAFFENYFVVSFDIWFPLLIIDIMKWSITELNLVIFGTGVWMIGACIILIYKQFTDHTIYVIAIFATFSIVFMEGVFMFLSQLNDNQILNIVIWIVFDFCYCFMVITEEVFLVGCLAKMVVSEIQTFVDSIRLTMYRLGGLVALATSALIFDWIMLVGCVHIIAAIFGTILLLVRRKTLGNPSVIIQ